MRLYATDRLRHLLRTLPRGRPLAWLEILLLVGLGIQIARLVWVAVTPVSPLGAWRPPAATILSPAARAALFARFDPFHRAAVPAGGTAAVTSLALKLYGIRVNEASGLGSAIIQTPDGQQASYSVGEKIIDGVTLKAVSADHVVIDKGGSDELLYIDQSQPAPVASPGAAPVGVPSDLPTPTTPGGSINFAPTPQPGATPSGNAVSGVPSTQFLNTSTATPAAPPPARGTPTPPPAASRTGS